MSFVSIVGSDDNAPHRCGYCGAAEASSVSFGVWAHRMTVADYQALIDRGWRRSGQYLYLPDILKTCCPAYTIRLDATRFKASRGNRKVIKKMKKWVGDGKGKTARKEGPDASSGDSVGGVVGVDEGDHAVDGDRDDAVNENDAVVDDVLKRMAMRKPDIVPDITDASAAVALETSSAVLDGVHQEPSKGISTHKNVPWVKNKTPKQARASDASELPDLIETAEKTGPGGHTLKVEMVPSCFHDDTFALYTKYQAIIHNDPPDKISKDGFLGFLVNTPLETIPRRPDQPPDFPGYGSFHQKYYMDDRLIAVAVLDILPNCVSSVYFMYDPVPEVMQLSLGVYSALREIYLTLKLSKSETDLKYYYMGYYIHSCPKMTYKAQFKPSELACRESFLWVPVDKCIVLLDQHNIARFSAVMETDRQASALSNNSHPPVGPNSIRLRLSSNVSDLEWQSVKCFSNGKLCLIKQLKTKPQPSKIELVKQLIVRTGTELMKNLIVVL